jgi:hypothetical protein
MPFVDTKPLMDSPRWGAISAAKRAEALHWWQDAGTSDADRVEMLKAMQQPPTEASGAERVVSNVGGMLKEVPGVVYGAASQLGRSANRASGYTPGPPAPKPQTPQEWEERTLPMQQELEEGANAIPGLMAGPAFGRAGYGAGEALLTRLGPRLAQRPLAQTAANALPAIGEAGGNYLSRQANVATGAEQPGMVGDIASAALPLAVRGATSAPAARRLPGSSAAQHEMAAEDVQGLTTRMQPATPAATLYGAVAQQHNPAIPVQGMRQTAQDIIARELREGATSRNDTVLGLAQEFEDLATQYQDNIPMDRFYERMQRIGERLRGAERTDTQGTRELSSLYAAFHGALENASQTNIPGAETLQQAIRASRQEHAVERLTRITGEGRGITTQAGTGYTLVSGKKMLNEFERLLADDDVFRGSFTADELADMRSVFEGANRVPALPPPPSVQRGAGKAAISGTMGGSIGYALGGPEGAQIGAMAGVAVPEVISRLMVTGPGRQMLRAAFDGRDIVRPEVLAVLNQAARQTGETYTSKRSGPTTP